MQFTRDSLVRFSEIQLDSVRLESIELDDNTDQTFSDERAMDTVF